MRAFTEVKKSNSSVVVEFSKDEAQIIAIAMFDYCEKNKRMMKAKKLLKEMDEKLEIY